MDGRARFSETSLSTKKEFCNNITMESITDTDYKHAKRIRKDFGLQSLGQYYVLYVQVDILLLADVCKFQKQVSRNF